MKWTLEELKKAAQKIDCYTYLQFSRRFFRDSDNRLNKYEQKLREKIEHRKNPLDD